MNFICTTNQNLDMKKRGFSHIEITMVLLGVLTIISIFIAAVGQNQDYDKSQDQDTTEEVARY